MFLFAEGEGRREKVEGGEGEPSRGLHSFLSFFLSFFLSSLPQPHI